MLMTVFHVGFDLDIHIGAEHVLAGTFRHQRIDSRQTV
jgi:hypothetical protein